jgi:hypothetical protein
LNLPSPSESLSASCFSSTSARRLLFSRGSPHELFAPFSTSSWAGPPTRVSITRFVPPSPLVRT